MIVKFEALKEVSHKMQIIITTGIMLLS